MPPTLSEGPGELARAPVYRALLQRPMLLGLPQQGFLLIAMLACIVAIATSLHPLVLVGEALLYLILLVPLRRLFEKEPFLTEILSTYFQWPAFMPHHGREVGRHWVDSVPRPPS